MRGWHGRCSKARRTRTSTGRKASIMRKSHNETQPSLAEGKPSLASRSLFIEELGQIMGGASGPIVKHGTSRMDGEEGRPQHDPFDE
jgi:hypothetical protein